MSWGRTPCPHQLHLTVYCVLILRWNWRKTTTLTKQNYTIYYNPSQPPPLFSYFKVRCVRNPHPPPPLKHSVSAAVLVHPPLFLIWTNQTLINQLNSSVLSRIYFSTFGPTYFIPPPPLHFPELDASPPRKGISGIAFTTNPAFSTQSSMRASAFPSVDSYFAIAKNLGIKI